VIVVDSSVWIAQLRGEDSAATRKLGMIVERADDRVLVGDLILLEVLQGARDEAHAARLERALLLYPVAAMLDETIAVQAARNYRHLRGRGVTVRKTVDMIIGTFCLVQGHVLLHDDRDFDPMAIHLGLEVVAGR
jgi:predicted nucleic acid-binding protein